MVFVEIPSVVEVVTLFVHLFYESVELAFYGEGSDKHIRRLTIGHTLRGKRKLELSYLIHLLQL